MQQGRVLPSWFCGALIIVQTLIILLATLLPVTVEINLPLAVFTMAALVTVIYLGYAVRRPVDLLTKMCLFLGSAGSLLSVVALLNVVFARLGLDYLSFSIYKFPHLFGLPRVSSIFGNPNTFGIFMFFCIAATMVLLILQKNEDPYNKTVALLFYFLLTLQFLALFLTFSRAAMLALILFGASFLWFHARRFCCIPLVLLVTSILFKSKALLNGEGIVEKILLLLNGRVELWNQGINIFLEHPLLGIGPGGWTSVSGQLLPIHNTYLQIAVELGVFGLLAYLSCIGLIMYGLWTELGRTDRGTGRYILLSSLFSLSLGVFAHQFFESHLYHGFPLYLFYLAAIYILAQEPNVSLCVYRSFAMVSGALPPRGRFIDLATSRQLINAIRSDQRRAS